jgi:hypothetical protein
LAKPRLRKPLEVLIPSDEELELERKKLRKFESWDTKELFSQVNIRKNQYSTRDEAITAVRNERKHQQIIELLALLGIDPTERCAGWKAFIKLAEIHHEVGRVVHRFPQYDAHTKVWTQRNEFELLYWVNEFVNIGWSERAAVYEIADNETFPYLEQFKWERRLGGPSRAARRNALWKKYMRIKPSKTSLYYSQTLESALGAPTASQFEDDLSLLVTAWYLQDSSGDK